MNVTSPAAGSSRHHNERYGASRRFVTLTAMNGASPAADSRHRLPTQPPNRHDRATAKPDAPQRTVSATTRIACTSALLTVLLGCDHITPNHTSTGKPTAPQPVVQLIDDLLSHHDGELIHETWYIHRIEDAKIGHRWSREFSVMLGKRPLIRTLTIDELRIPRFGRTIDQSIRAATLETPSGEVLQLAYRVTSGRSERSYRASVSGDTLHWETEDGKRRRGTTAWQQGTGGYHFLERSLRDNPLASGEQRELRTMMPLLETPLQYRVSAADQVKGDLLEVDCFTSNQSQPSSTLRVDPDGVQQQTYRFLGREMVRTDEVGAMAPNDRPDFDVAFALSVPIDPVDQAALEIEADQRSFKITLTDDNPVDQIPSGGYQTVQPVDERTAIVTFRPASLSRERTSENVSDRPTNNDIQPNRWLESQSKPVRAFAAGAGTRSGEPLAVAEVLQQHVHQSLEQAELGKSLSTAAQVATNRSGDCTEHAMLLAAACRVYDIPSRVAVGLLYVPTQSAFIYHMWTEASGLVPEVGVPLKSASGGCAESATLM